MLRILGRVMRSLVAATMLAALMVISNGCGLLGKTGPPGPTAEEILREALTQVDVDLVSLDPDIDIEPGQGVLPIPSITLAFDIELGLENNSAIPLLAKAADLNLFTARRAFSQTPATGEALAVASFTKDVTIPKGERRVLPLRLEADAEKVGREIVALINGGDLFYRLDAAMNFHYKGVTLPLQITLDEGGGSIGG